MKKKMKSLVRASAFAMACALALGSSPARAEETPQQPETDPVYATEGILFKQSGFKTTSDPTKAVLSMELKVKPENGQAVQAGYFTFRYDSDRLTPLLTDGTLLSVPPLGDVVASGLANDNAIWYRAYQGSETGNVEMSETPIDQAIKWNLETPFFDIGDYGRQISIYALSDKRKDNASLVDAYLYFEFDTAIPVASDGWATIATLDFSCYNGGEAIVDTSFLNVKSFNVPTTEAEAADILAQFGVSYTENSGEEELGGAPGETHSLNLATGAAAYSTADGSNHHYFAQPTGHDVRDWQGNLVYHDWSTSASISGAPGVYYDGMDNSYTMEQLAVNLTNSYGDNDADFPIPSGQGGDMVRYSIPTKATEEANNGNWLAYNYVGPDKESKQVALTYEIATIVTANSISRPELSDYGMGLEPFLGALKWEFVTKDGTPLSELTRTDETTPVEVNGKRVSQATLSTADTYPAFDGCKVQIVYDEGGSVAAVTPVGVTLELPTWSDWGGTEVTYRTDMTGDVTDKAMSKAVPQLHITKEAADLDSMIWVPDDGGVKGMIYFRASFTDDKDKTFYSSVIEAQLNRAAAEPTRVVVTDLQSLGAAPAGSGAAAEIMVGQRVSNDGTNTITGPDPIVSGVAVKAAVYDQYDLPIEDQEVQFEIVPSADTETAMTAAGKSNVFQMVSVDTTTSKIMYKPTFGPYNVYGGNYVIKATCGSVNSDSQLESERTIHVVRPNNFLYNISLLMSYGLTSYTDTPPAATVWEIPELTRDGQKQTASIDTYFLSVNSQYVAPGTVGDGEKQIYEDLVRNSDSTLNLQDLLSRDNLDITFEWKLESGLMPLEGSVVLDTDKNSPTYGRLSVNSSATNCVILYMVHVTYGGGDSGVPEITKTATGRLELRRTATRLETLKLLDVEKTVVPTPTEVALNGHTTVELVAECYDQYGEYLDWSVVQTLYAPGSAKNPHGPEFQLTFNVVDALPTGIQQLTANGPQFRVNSEAQTCSFQVQAKYAQPGLGGPTSKIVTVEIQRAAPVLDHIGTVKFPGAGVVYSPSKVSSPETVTPTYTFYDQYNIEITDTEDITLTWSVYGNGTTAIQGEEFELDYRTGAVSVLPCARDGKTVTVRLVAWQEGQPAEQRCTKISEPVQIKRHGPIVELAEVITDTVDYPLISDSGDNIKLQAQGTSQYGDAELITPESGIKERWTLVSVTTPGGEIKATDNKAANVTLYTDGRVNFARQSVSSFIATSMKVKVLLASSRESVVKEVRINFEDAVATRIFVAGATTQLLDVPETIDGVAATRERELIAYVQDQYGINMPSHVASWRLNDIVYYTSGADESAVQFITRDGHSYIQITSAASECEAKLTAYNDELDLSTTCAVRITKGNLVVTDVRITSGDVFDMPGQAERTRDYTMTAEVIDNFGAVMPAEAVSWTATGCNVEIDSSTGVLTVPFHEAVRTAGTGTVQLIVRSNTNPLVTMAKPITIQKGTPVPTYAAWDMLRVTYADSTAPGGTTTKEIYPGTGTIYFVVPGRDDPNTIVELHGKVYSQYEEEIPGALPVWSFNNEVSGTTLTNDAATGVGRLEVTYLASGFQLELQAAPADAPERTENMTNGTTSNLYAYYEKGVAYCAETELDPDNDYVMELPKWDPVGDYLVDEEASYSEIYSLKALVNDQYNRPMPVIASYPVWEMVDETPGVVLLADQDDPKGLGRITGNSVSLMVEHNTLAEGEVSRDIRIRVYAANEAQSEELMKVFTVTLVKEEAEPTYIYWTDVDESGVSQHSVETPTKIENSASYDLTATVYDQYGYVMEYEQLATKPEWHFNHIEDVYPGCTVTPINGGKGTEFTYNGYKMAAIEHATGKLTIYYAATVPSLPLVASIGAATPRDGSMPLSWAVLEPAVMELTQDPYYDDSGELVEPGRIEMTGDEPVQAGLTAVIYDQFGYIVKPEQEIPDIDLYWEIWNSEDEDGPWIPYVEYYDDGTEKAAEDYTIRMLEDSSRRGILWVDHENTAETGYFLSLRAKARYADGTVTDVGKEVRIELYTVLNSGGKIKVYFDAGLNGELDGESMIEVFRGRTPTAVPEVVPDEGFAFLGWTSDGERLVNPSRQQIYRAITFTAVYEESKDAVLGGGIVATGLAAPSASFINGRSGGTLELDEGVTRAEFIKMVVVGLVGYDEAYDYGETYADVPMEAWYANYIACAKAAGVLPEGETIRPTEIITRDEAAEILALVLGLTPIEAPTEEQCFLDVDVEYWAAGTIAALKEAGIVKGGSAGLFGPTNELQRDEAIALVVRAQNLYSEEVMRDLAAGCDEVPFPDIAVGNWAYPYVLSAAGYLSVS